MKLRPYQEEISTKAKDIVQKYGIVLLSLEVRTGKTIISLETIKKLWKKKALFVTKKKAISSIESDYSHYNDFFILQVTNYESIHKVIDKDFDIIILDESHVLSAFPKPSGRHKNVKKMFGHLPMILLSGTSTPESYSQFFHQFFTQKYWVWVKYKNFYDWCRSWYVKVYQIRTSYGMAQQYDRANYDKIMRDIKHLIITFTQKEAWFTTSVQEEVLYVKMSDKVYDCVKRLQKDKVIESKDDVLLADTMVKEKSKIHQIYSWTVKLESWRIVLLDDTKARFIKERFKNNKIAIFYNFKWEKELLYKVFWDTITDDLDEFNTTDKNICLQIVSWREGISLKKAEFLVYYNISFSAVSYWQSRDRLTTMERKENTIYWVFTEGWLEDDIYKAVMNKKSFTTKMYEVLTWKNK